MNTFFLTNSYSSIKNLLSKTKLHSLQKHKNVFKKRKKNPVLVLPFKKKVSFNFIFLLPKNYVCYSFIKKRFVFAGKFCRQLTWRSYFSIKHNILLKFSKKIIRRVFSSLISLMKFFKKFFSQKMLFQLLLITVEIGTTLKPKQIGG